MEEKKSPYKYYMLALSDEDRCHIKARAAIKGMSIRKWIIQAIAEAIKKEDLLS